MSQQNREVALKFLKAMGSNDPETAATCFSPDAVTVTKGFSAFSGERDAKTVVQMIDFFKQLMPSGLRLEIKTVTGSDGRVIIEAEGNAVTADDKSYCNHYCFVFTVQNGKIRHLNEYLCTKTAEEVLWPTAKAMMDARSSS